MTCEPSHLSFIIISIVIHPRHCHRHRHCRHHHHRHHHHHHHHHQHHHFSCVLSSCLLPPAFFEATLSSSAFLCAIAVSLFEAKLILQILRSVIRIVNSSSNFAVFCCSLFLEPCLGNCSWKRCLTLVHRNLAWEPILRNLLLGAYSSNLFLGTCSWKLCLLSSNLFIGTLLGNLFFITLLGNLVSEPVLRNLAWDFVRASNLACSCSWEPCLGTCLGILLGNPGTLVGTSSWEPCLGTSSW